MMPSLGLNVVDIMLQHLHNSLDSNMADFVVVHILGPSRVDDWLVSKDRLSVNGLHTIDVVGQVHDGTRQWFWLSGKQNYLYLQSTLAYLERTYTYEVEGADVAGGE